MKRLLAAILLLCGCEKQVRRQWLSMGTVASVQCVDADRAKKLCEAEFNRCEEIFSAWKSDSVLAKWNRGERAETSEEFAKLLNSAEDLARKSGNAFNSRVAGAMKKWGFNGTETPEAVDLGAIAKGYAVDRAFDILQKEGCKEFLIDLGGNLRVAGRDRITGVRDPFKRQTLAAKFTLYSGEAVATSGNYERFVEIKGKRYAHILDGRTMQPVEGMAGVTVVAPAAELADGLSTTLFVLGKDAGTEFLRKFYPRCRALFIPDTPDAPQVIPAGDWDDTLQVLYK